MFQYLNEFISASTGGLFDYDFNARTRKDEALRHVAVVVSILWPGGDMALHLLSAGVPFISHSYPGLFINKASIPLSVTCPSGNVKVASGDVTKTHWLRASIIIDIDRVICPAASTSLFGEKIIFKYFNAAVAQNVHKIQITTT